MSFTVLTHQIGRHYSLTNREFVSSGGILMQHTYSATISLKCKSIEAEGGEKSPKQYCQCLMSNHPWGTYP